MPLKLISSFLVRACRRLAALALLATCVNAPAALAGSHAVSLAVSLAPGAPASYTVRGWITEIPNGRPIVVLLGGATESGINYWDFPGPSFYAADPLNYGPMRDQYSLVEYLESAGYPTLALDRIGTGQSDHPPAQLVTIESNVFVIDQVVSALRAGAMSGQRFKYSRVIGAGRSLAGPMVDMEAGVNHGFDGIIVQSFGHNPAPAFATFPSALEPAQLEPRFASLPPGYYTTRPAIAPLEPTSPRATFFFQPAGQYDPAVVATEEAGKSTMTDAEVPTFPPAFAFSQLVTVPVLSILGADDSFFCSSEACPESAEEAASYPNASSFEAHLIPAVGHDMDLEFNGKPLVFPAILDWLTRKF